MWEGPHNTSSIIYRDRYIHHDLSSLVRLEGCLMSTRFCRRPRTIPRHDVAVEWALIEMFHLCMISMCDLNDHRCSTDRRGTGSRPSRADPVQNGRGPPPSSAPPTPELRLLQGRATAFTRRVNEFAEQRLEVSPSSIHPCPCMASSGWRDNTCLGKWPAGSLDRTFKESYFLSDSCLIPLHSRTLRVSFMICPPLNART